MLQNSDKRNTKIAEIYFRIDVDQIEHMKNVYKLMDLLGDVGGVSEVVVWTIFFLFGGFLKFNQQMEIMINMYDYDAKKKVMETCFKEGGQAEEEEVEGRESIDVMCCEGGSTSLKEDEALKQQVNVRLKEKMDKEILHSAES